MLEQIVFRTKTKVEQQLLIVMDKSINEEQLSQTLQTKNEHFVNSYSFSDGL